MELLVAKSLDNLHPTLMRPRVEAFLADPEARALGIFLISGFRSIERQRQLFEAAVRKYGSEAKARKWVAPPGKSNHGPKVDGFGTAIDIGLPGVKAVSGDWPDDIERQVNAIAARHGLASPMDWEDWHFEPIADFTPSPIPQPTTPQEVKAMFDNHRFAEPQPLKFNSQNWMEFYSWDPDTCAVFAWNGAPGPVLSAEGQAKAKAAGGIRHLAVVPGKGWVAVIGKPGEDSTWTTWASWSLGAEDRS